MIGVLLSPNTWIGGAIAAGAVLAWAVFWHGPNQYQAGGIATAARLDAATSKAAKELFNEADQAALLRRQCLARGGVYDFGASKCIEGSTD